MKQQHTLYYILYMSVLFATGSLQIAEAHAAAPGSQVDSSNTLYLDVKINGQFIYKLLRFRQIDNKLYITGEELNQAGLLLTQINLKPDTEIRLDAIPGVSYTYDASAQTIDLQVPNSLRQSQQLNAGNIETIPAARATRGLALNYDLYTQTELTKGMNSQGMAFYHDLRYFDINGVLTSSGTANLGNHASQRYIRYDTVWSHSDPTTQHTLNIGDTTSSALEWTRALRFGGLQWRKDFDLRPDLITFPGASLSSSTVVPSVVDLYINGIQQYSGNVASGPFTINQMPGINGLGVATVVTHDAVGHVITTSVPLYVDTRLLKNGLSAYALETGVLRHNYGNTSFDYGRAIANASIRYGFADNLTLEGHVEGAPSQYTLGFGSLIKLGISGVMTAALSGSTGRYDGGLYSLGYRYIHPHFSIDLLTTRTLANYGDIGTLENSPVSKVSDRLTISMPLGHQQNLSGSWINQESSTAISSNSPTNRSSIGSLTYSNQLNNIFNLHFNAFQDFSSRNRGVLLGLDLMLDRHTVMSSAVGVTSGHANDSLSITSPANYEGGWGWMIQAGTGQGIPYEQGQLQYLNRYGRITGSLQNSADQTAAALDIAGSLVLMDGTVMAARQLGSGFALVSTDGVPGIPVLHENRIIGRTDTSGHFLVPDLNAYQRNQLAIDTLGLPADIHMLETSQIVTPQMRSGLIARFPVENFSAASIRLITPTGQPLLDGLSVHHIESGQDTVTGFDGIAFIEHLNPGINHLTIHGEDMNCSATLSYQRPMNHTLPTIGPITCQP